MLVQMYLYICHTWKQRKVHTIYIKSAVCLYMYMKEITCMWNFFDCACHNELYKNITMHLIAKSSSKFDFILLYSTFILDSISLLLSDLLDEFLEKITDFH